MNLGVHSISHVLAIAWWTVLLFRPRAVSDGNAIEPIIFLFFFPFPFFLPWGRGREPLRSILSPQKNKRTDERVNNGTTISHNIAIISLTLPTSKVFLFRPILPFNIRCRLVAKGGSAKGFWIYLASASACCSAHACMLHCITTNPFV